MLIITGAEQGLGEAIANEFSRSGFPVRNIPGDVIRQGKDAIEASIAKILTKHNPQFVINNFGINHLSWIGSIPEEDEEILRVNVMGPMWVVNSLVAHGVPGCRVMNIASATHRVPQRTTALYCASKAALVQMTRVMARELAPKGWVVNSFAPGAITDTQMNELTNEQVRELRGWTEEEMACYANSLVPMGRATNRAEIAQAVMDAIMMPEYVNGHCFEAMGGV